MVNSTLSGNSAAYGGGIYTASSTLAIQHSTIVGNNANPGQGGGLYVRWAGPIVSLSHTIVAGNASEDLGIDQPAEPVFTSGGYNLIGNTTFDTGNGTDLLNTAPLLGPLQDNGGPTFTSALLAGSPAIDAGDPVSPLNTDQRGSARPVNGRIDIGAVELADLQDPPLNFLQTINDSAIVLLTDIVVGLHLVGVTEGSGFASEMFVSLNKDLSLTSILINRVGITGGLLGDPVGQGYDGWNVSFQDGTIDGDVHAATLVSGVLTGLYEPDGRVLPTDVARPSLLASFMGSPGNGDWRLNVGDLALGGLMRLESWSLTLKGETSTSHVPEASTYAAGIVGVIGWCRRGGGASRPNGPQRGSL